MPYILGVIKSFKSKALKLFAATGNAKKLSVPNADRVRRILVALDAAQEPKNMAVPGFDFHELTGNRKGTYSVSASGNYRITFEWEDGNPVRVDIEDYH